MKKYLLLLIVPIAFACSKKQGPEGPAGQDADFLIENFIVYENNWTPFNNFGDPDFGYEAIFVWPSLSQYMLENSLVQVYLRDGSTLIPLPLTTYLIDYTSTLDYIMSPQQMNFGIRDSDGQTQPPVGVYEFKAVVATQSDSRRYKNYNLHDEVEAKTGMKVIESPSDSQLKKIFTARK